MYSMEYTAKFSRSNPHSHSHSHSELTVSPVAVRKERSHEISSVKRGELLGFALAEPEAA
jgi:hypothetical protein